MSNDWHCNIALSGAGVHISVLYTPSLFHKGLARSRDVPPCSLVPPPTAIQPPRFRAEDHPEPNLIPTAAFIHDPKFYVTSQNTRNFSCHNNFELQTVLHIVLYSSGRISNFLSSRYLCDQKVASPISRTLVSTPP